MNKEFCFELDRFVEHINSIKDSFPLVMIMLEAKKYSDAKLLEDYIKNKKIRKTKAEKGYFAYKVKLDDLKGFNDRKAKVHSSSLALKIVPRNFIVALLSYFDVLIGGIIRVMYLKVPEMFNDIDTGISYSTLSDFKTIEEAKWFIVEKEIEKLLRKSHSDQFKWFENRLKIPFRTELDSWPLFIEITERRNLFVHCDGIISRSYIENCSKTKLDICKENKLGDELHVNPEYFNNACDCITEIGVKLGHVIWRKIAEKEREEADNNLNNLAYELICTGNHKLAIEILNFATKTIKKHSSEEIYLYMLLNKAQAQKWMGDRKACEKTLVTIDWSAKKNIFKLVVAVLKNKYAESAKIMTAIGDSGEVSKHAYREWPIFNEFRKKPIFKRAYKKIFNEEFRILEKPVDMIEAALKKAKKQKE